VYEGCVIFATGVDPEFQKKSFLKTQLLFKKSNSIFINQFYPTTLESPKENVITSLDCWENIFTFLHVNELFKLLSVDKNMNGLVTESEVWENLYQRDFKGSKGLGYDLERVFKKKNENNWFNIYKIKLYHRLFYQPMLFHCLNGKVSVGLAHQGKKFTEPMVYFDEQFFDQYSQNIINYKIWGSQCRNGSTPIVKDGKFTTEIEEYIEQLYEKFFPYYENLRQMRYFSPYFHTIKPVTSVYPVLFLEWDGMTRIQKNELKKAFLKVDAPSLKFVTKSQSILAKYSKESGIVVFLNEDSIRIVMNLKNIIDKEILMKDSAEGVQKLRKFIKPMEELVKQHGIIFHSEFENLQEVFLNSFKDDFAVKSSFIKDIWEGMVIYSQCSNTFTNVPCELINVESLAKEQKDFSKFNFSQNSILNFEKFNSEGRSPIHIAAYFGNLEFIKLSESLGVNLNLKEKKFGQNILHISCAAGRMNVVEYLMNIVKMDPKVKDKDNLTCNHLSKLKMIKDFIRENESNNSL
jgi:hypothetical protein